MTQEQNFDELLQSQEGQSLLNQMVEQALFDLTNDNVKPL